MNKTQKCKKGLSFDQCELQVAKIAVKTAMENKARLQASNPDVQRMTRVVEDFLRETRCVCYGGTAINNLLPTTKQFYNLETQVPDYDMYSPTPIHHAKMLADMYKKQGFTFVEAKSGVHMGTYKVYVNFMPMADITQMDKTLFKAVSTAAILKNGIYYADPNLLRQSMYVELSSPNGDIERWNKVLPRLASLNEEYPMNSESCKLQQPMANPLYDFKKQNELAALIENNLIARKVMFIGGFADALYATSMKPAKKVRTTPDYDAVAEDAWTTAKYLKDELVRAGYAAKIVKHAAVGELISEHFEIKIEKDTVAFIYGTTACHSYNVFVRNGNEIRVATIDTLLSFYLAFLYVDRPYMNKDRVMCMSSLLFQVQRQNLFEQTGILKRFSLTCYGKQTDMAGIRRKKSIMRTKLKRGTPEYERWFLDYRP
jgi:hypothetical protein